MAPRAWHQKEAGLAFHPYQGGAVAKGRATARIGNPGREPLNAIIRGVGVFLLILNPLWWVGRPTSKRVLRQPLS